MKAVRHSSSLIRSTFLDYFKKNDHSFIRSSPVAPFSDPSLAFVNAGMNQFKNILLGHQVAPSPRVVNSQKCIRVGGKHNDLAAVGSDSFHHTFFEMLGNWSFGDYFKKEACSMAWNFLTSSPISIPPNHLYVTYFSGDEKLGLPEDLETKEIWLSLGVDKDRILPFGIKENFWEMGKTGPCGSCTEIHYDYSGKSASERSRFVNKGFSDVIELWNIVFIEYNRDLSLALKPLSIQHVDTGMGFERFVAVMQGKTSNYDTDLFMPLFNVISEVTNSPSYTGKFGSDDKNGLDTAYRILADHIRMCVVAIADNMFPDQNHKLRRVLRKALMTAENSFKAKKDYKLIQEVANRVSDILSPVYPEISANMKKIHFIVEQESELIKELKKVTAKQWKSIVSNDNRLLNVFTGIEAVGLPSAYNEIIASVSESDKLLKDDLALKLYDTYGLSIDLIDDLASALGLKFSEEGLINKISELKKERMKNKHSVTKNPRVEKFVDKMMAKNVKFTNDEFKYVYETSLLNDKENYSFPDVKADIQSILLLDNKIPNDNCYLFLNENDVILKDGYEVAIVLDKTNFYTEAGGQSGDVGQIKLIDKLTDTVVCLIDVKEVIKYYGYVLHFGKICKVCEKSTRNVEFKLNKNEITAVLNVDPEKRLSNMRNHTATHLINCVIRKLLTATCQKSSYINSDHLIFDFAVYKEKFSNKTAVELEKMVNDLIRSRLPVSRRIINANEFLALDDVTLIPDVIYPDNEISLIEIIDENKNAISKEPCCGTHVFNTGDIDEFCLINVKSAKTNVKSIKAVTGVNAKIAGKNNKLILEKLRQFDEKIKLLLNDVNVEESVIDGCNLELQNFKNELLSSKDKYFSYSVLCNTIESLSNYSKELNKLTRSNRKELLKLEMKTVVDNLECKKYLVHNIISCSDLDSSYSTLQKAEKMCPSDIPVMLFNYSNDNILKARCIIPEHMVEHLPADKWMSAVCKVIGTSQTVYLGHDPKLTCGMRPKKIPKHKANDLINIAIAEAKVIVEDSLSSLKQ